MRALLLIGLASSAACSLVVASNTDEYEGACADQEEAVGGTYHGQPLTGVATECSDCTTEDCTEECLVSETDGAITFECAGCFADFARCLREECRDICFDHPDLDLCLGCVCVSNCGAQANECAGITVANCPGT